MKNNLTENQREFLLNRFFQNSSYVGWKNVAEKLLDNGHCIVAGEDCIWIGNIGNFIQTSEAKDAVDCLLYEFNLKIFLTSEFYKENWENKVASLNADVIYSTIKYNEIKALV